jgi:hypothetical protein
VIATYARTLLQKQERPCASSSTVPDSSHPLPGCPTHGWSVATPEFSALQGRRDLAELGRDDLALEMVPAFGLMTDPERVDKTGRSALFLRARPPGVRMTHATLLSRQ